MKPEDFLDMLPKYFWRKMAGFYKLINLKQRQEWERTRWQTWLLLNVHVDSGKRLKITDLIEFDWEKENKKFSDNNKDYAEYIKKLEDYKLKVKKQNGK
tara:strand:- start:3619 stop:3915 length:297 start_codon:yes stop_codon:yes gene_type:complete